MLFVKQLGTTFYSEYYFNRSKNIGVKDSSCLTKKCDYVDRVDRNCKFVKCTQWSLSYTLSTSVSFPALAWCRLQAEAVGDE